MYIHSSTCSTVHAASYEIRIIYSLQNTEIPNHVDKVRMLGEYSKSNSCMNGNYNNKMHIRVG